MIQDSQAFSRLTSMVAVSSAQSLQPRDQINGGKLRGDYGFPDKDAGKAEPGKQHLLQMNLHLQTLLNGGQNLVELIKSRRFYEVMVEARLL